MTDWSVVSWFSGSGSGVLSWFDCAASGAAAGAAGGAGGAGGGGSDYVVISWCSGAGDRDSCVVSVSRPR